MNAECGKDSGIALEKACGGGHEEVARLLLDRGGDVNAKGGKYGLLLFLS